MARTPNEADIEAMLRDFNDSDQMLKSVSCSTDGEAPILPQPVLPQSHKVPVAAQTIHAAAGLPLTHSLAATDKLPSHPTPQYTHRYTHTHIIAQHSTRTHTQFSILCIADPLSPRSRRLPHNGAMPGPTSSTTSWPAPRACTASTSPSPATSPASSTSTPPPRPWSAPSSSKRPLRSSRRT